MKKTAVNHNVVDKALACIAPLHGGSYKALIKLENLVWLPKSHNEEIISVICPLLELTTPTPEVCVFLTKYCRENPRSRIVLELFIPIVQRILKHNMTNASSFVRQNPLLAKDSTETEHSY
ncbi:c-Maf-inducing protein [Trichonephila clavipes]|nr:c-Maf-inducing protein [Trichonephila clavipes]